MHLYLHILKGKSSRLKRKLKLAKGDGQNNRNANCRLCKKKRKYSTRASCPKLSTSMYLPLRHDKVAKVIYDALIDSKNQRKGMVGIYNEGNTER